MPACARRAEKRVHKLKTHLLYFCFISFNETMYNKNYCFCSSVLSVRRAENILQYAVVSMSFRSRSTEKTEGVEVNKDKKKEKEDKEEEKDKDVNVSTERVLSL